MENGAENAYTPAYLSVPRLEMLIDKVSKLSVKKVDRATLQTFGLSGSDVSLGSVTLKFLGIINENEEVVAETTNLLRSMDQQKHKEGLVSIIKKSYSKLFEMRPDIDTASRDDIAETIRITYDVSPRIAKSAAPAFMYLCQRAGLREEDEELQRRKSSPRKRQPQSKRQTEERTIPDPNSSNVLLNQSSKRRVLEGVGWRVVVESDFHLDKEVRSSLLDLENSLEELSQSNTDVEKANEKEE